jgi:TatD DNase family protein
MQLIDTHTHIYLPEFDSDRDEAVNRAVSSGITTLLLPNIDIESVEPMLLATERYRGICYPMLGLHPTSVKADFESQLAEFESLISRHNFVAIGEIGIDLYWDKTFINEQLIALRRQIEFALAHHLPVVIHSRDAFPEVFSVLDEFRGTALRGVFHAFTGSLEDAEKAIASGFLLGIGGIVTFKNSGLDKIVKIIGPEHIILETDSPYLAPVPFRGKRNESSYLLLINQKLSEIFGISEEKTASIVYANSVGLFNLKKQDEK